MKLGEIADLIRGVSFEGADASFKPKPGFAPILRAGNISDSLITDRDLIWVPEERITAQQRLRAGDIAICMSSGSATVVGKTAVARSDFDGSVGAFCGIVRPRPELDAGYLALWFHSPAYWAWRDSQSRGANIQNLRLSQLSQVDVPVPSMEVQRLVTQRLNAQLTFGAHASANSLARIRSIEDLRASVIRDAFDSATGRRMLPLSRVGTLTDGDWILNADYAASGVRLLQVGDVGRGDLRIKSQRYVSVERANELGCTLLRAGDILISRMPYPIGRACVLPDLGYPAITAVDVTILRIDYDVVDPEFLASYLESTEWLASVAGRASGATRPRISRANLEALLVPVPPLEQQREVALELRGQLSSIAEMQAASLGLHEVVESLPAALLRLVFGQSGGVAADTSVSR